MFDIDSFKTYKIINIAARDCDYVMTNRGIFMGKVASYKTIPFDTLEIATIAKHKGNKWGFMADYWKKNYKRFSGK